MVPGLSSRVSWICLLLFSSGACFPATKGDYKYPYTSTRLSGGGSAPGSSNLQSGGSSAPLVSVQHGPSANFQQPAGSVQQPNSPTGNQSPSSLGAPSSMANRFLVNHYSSAPVAPSSGAGYVSPPVGTGKKTPSFPAQSQPAVGSSGASNTGSYGLIYAAPSFSYPAGNAAAAGGVAEPVSYQDPFSDSSISWDNMPEGAFAFPAAPVPSDYIPDYPIYSLSQEGGSQETSPLPPSSYIIQSRNGYQRARAASSYMTYSPEYLPPVSDSRKGASGGKGGMSGPGTGMSGPGTGMSGGRKI